MLEFPYRGQPGLARLHVAAAAAAAAVAAIATASAASAAMPSPLSAPAASLTPCRRRRRAAALGAPLPPRCRSRRALPLACASERAPVRMHAPELARGCTHRARFGAPAPCACRTCPPASPGALRLPLDAPQ